MKYCPICHAAGEDQDTFCRQCGSSYPAQQGSSSSVFNANMDSPSDRTEQRIFYPPVYPVYYQKTDGLAIASLVLGIVSVLIDCFYGFGVFPGIVGLILGIISKVRISKSNNSINGSGMAIAGIVLSSVSILFAIIILIAVISVIGIAAHSAGTYSNTPGYTY